jgi:dCMP deaminase
MPRPSKEETFLQFAELLARRSTCGRLSVGAVVTDEAMLQVLGIGYNGNARGLPNQCDDVTATGSCGCLHAEINALLKAPGALPNKTLFTSHSPCAGCAKAILNAGVARVVYRQLYRSPSGVQLLVSSGVEMLWIPAVVTREVGQFDQR